MPPAQQPVVMGAETGMESRPYSFSGDCKAVAVGERLQFESVAVDCHIVVERLFGGSVM